MSNEYPTTQKITQNMKRLFILIKSDGVRLNIKARKLYFSLRHML